MANTDAQLAAFVGRPVSGAEAWWKEQGYIYGRDIGDDMWICVAPMLFTFRLMLCTPGGVIDFYCYERMTDALDAAADWDGRSEPTGWVKSHTRAHGEIHA